MKIPFITGGEDCECRGSGKLVYYVKLFNGDRSTIHGQCPCVQAHEATIETVKVRLPHRNILTGEDETVPVMVHRLVPVDA